MAKYNTIGVNVKRIETTVTQRQFRAIEGVRHLTPASEAVMENCLLPKGSKILVPTREQTIKENSPGYEPPIPEPVFEQPRDEGDEQPDWETAQPSRAALRKIEREPAVA